MRTSNTERQEMSGDNIPSKRKNPDKSEYDHSENSQEGKEGESKTKQSPSGKKLGRPKKTPDNDKTTPSSDDPNQVIKNFGSGGLIGWLRDISLLNSLDSKEAYSKDDKGKYKYSLRIREAYGRFAKESKKGRTAGKIISDLGKAVTDGYSQGWGSR